MRREAMSRLSRILLTKEKTAVAAPPPEAVGLESDFVIILAVLLCALICVVGLIAAARCAWRRRSDTNRQDSQRSSANKGLKKKVLQSIPIFTYTGTSQDIGTTNSVMLASSPLSSECAICLGEFVQGDEIRVLPQCCHGFHVACIDRWLGSHSSCPSCRQILVVGRCQKCGRFPLSAGTEPQSNTEADTPVAPAVNNAFLP